MLISHINTRSKVTGHNGPHEVKEALENSDIGMLNIFSIMQKKKI